MGKNDMDHMQHLESVALSDCAVLEIKEGTYKGSWKRAGGRSAWFMARRNLDRLITMMSPKEFPDHIKTYENVRDTVKALDVSVHYRFDAATQKINPLPGTIEATRDILSMLLDSYESEDIFMKIRANPGGEDGTVLACLRDARRYFMLVEAEMISEGVVEPESQTYEMENEPEWDGQAIDTFILDFDNGNRYTFPGLTRCLVERQSGTCKVTLAPAGNFSIATRDPYEVVAEENGMSVEQLKVYLLDFRHPPIARQAPPPPSHPTGGYAAEQAERHPETKEPRDPWTDMVGARLRIGDHCTFNYRGSIVECEIVGTEGSCPVVKGPKLPDEGVVVTNGWWIRRDGTKDNVLEKRGEQTNHAKQNPLWPWQAVKIEFDTLVSRVGVANSFYTRRAPEVWQLNPVVYSVACPKEIAQAYEWVEHGLWVLDRRKVPSEIDGNFPRLQMEMNMKEHEESDGDFKFMYDRDDGDGKFKIKDRWTAWGREAA
jgi:hypothetical protein